MRKLCTSVLVIVVSGILLVGCGKSSSSTARTETGTPATSTTTETPLTAKQQVENCVDQVRKTASLSATDKARLEKSCTKAGGSTAAQRKVVHEVCEAFALHLTGASRERALRICRTAP